MSKKKTDINIKKRVEKKKPKKKNETNIKSQKRVEKSF